MSGGIDIPYRSIVENYAKEHPFRRDRTPKLSRNIYQPPDLVSHDLCKSTHCYTAIHMAFRRGLDEEKGCSRDTAQRSNYSSVLPFELSQSRRIVFMENNKEDVDSHGKCPEYICQWKPVRFVVSVCVTG